LLIVRLFSPITVLLEETDEIQQATASLARLVGVTQIPLDRPQQGGRRRVWPHANTAAVEMTRIVAGYGDDPSVLHGVSLRIEPGERVAIVGPSGAGKTTLARVVAGLSIPRSGQVWVEGASPSQLDGSERVRLVAMVAQEGHVFGRSIADNVRLARPEASDAEVVAALEVVDAMTWVRELPGGIDTIVGQGQRRLGPPQSQQLGLARIVCADPKVVILDEATGQLDPAAAARTERHLRRALSGRTVVTVAHRLNVAASADRVVVMDRGRIVAQGAHPDLVAAGGVYSEMWASWIATRSND
jgi:ATP-binding cassette, subfamily C, bacterial